MENKQRDCEHCGEAFRVASTGRPPRYCSATCRKAAWDARRIEDEVARRVEAEREAHVASLARAAASERRRSFRGDETLPGVDIRGNETPVQATPPTPPAAAPRRRRSGMTAAAMPLPWPDEEYGGG